MHARSAALAPIQGALGGCVHTHRGCPASSAPPVSEAGARGLSGTRPGRRRRRPGAGVVCGDAPHEGQRQVRASRVHALAVPAVEADVDGRSMQRELQRRAGHPGGDAAAQADATLSARFVAGGVRRALRARLQEDGRTRHGSPAAAGGGLLLESRGASTDGAAHHAAFRAAGTPAVAPLCPVSHKAIWEQARAEATTEAQREPFLASFMYSSILAHSSLQASLASFLAEKLSCPVLPATQLFQSFTAAYAEDPCLLSVCYADLQAVIDRDPACRGYVHCILFFKGFQALQAHRVAHHLWAAGRLPLALSLQSRVSEAMQVDIHPAAVIGPGLMLDHATGVVIGETAVVGKNCSFLHKVTLGGTGATAGDRHPKIGDGVLIGAGVSVLGPVRVGNGVKIGAGSVVLEDVPDRCTAVGVPARVIARQPELPASLSPGDVDVAAEPAILMDQIIAEDAEDSSHWIYII